jgi:hypothetical protein
MKGLKLKVYPKAYILLKTRAVSPLRLKKTEFIVYPSTQILLSTRCTSLVIVDERSKVNLSA